MTSTTTTASLISTCRRLLSSLQTDEACAAVDACDAWLEQQDRSRRLARLTSRPAPELLRGILRAIHPEDQKRTFAACSQINKAWRRVAWSLFWKEVTVSHKFPPRKFVHPWTVKMMGGNVRSLIVGAYPSEVCLHPSPAMAGLRMIELDVHPVKVGNLLSLFLHSPNLISLHTTVLSEELNDVGRGDYWKNHPPGSKEIWQGGFKQLKALNFSVACVHGEPFPSGPLLDMADSLGSNLESLKFTVSGVENRCVTNSIFRKVASNCPNLRNFSTPYNADMAPIRHLLHSMPHLLSLGLSYNVSDEMLQLVASTCTTLKYLRINCRCLTTIRPFAQGPSLRGCQIFGWNDVNIDANELHAFLRHTGPTLESFSLDFHYEDGEEVHSNPGDHILECLRECAPNLRLLEILPDTEEGVVTEEGVPKFMYASRKLRYMNLPNNLMMSDRIHVAAAERNMVVDHGRYHSYTYEISPFPSYVELMKERWIGT